MVDQEGDPEVMLAVLEKKAELAPRFKVAQEAILASQTYGSDWTQFDGKMCLSAAGAERVGRLFDIQYFETTWLKEEFTDSIGKGYRYVYECKAALGIPSWIEQTFRGLFGCELVGEQLKAGETSEDEELPRLASLAQVSPLVYDLEGRSAAGGTQEVG